MIEGAKPERRLTRSSFRTRRLPKLLRSALWYSAVEVSMTVPSSEIWGNRGPQPRSLRRKRSPAKEKWKRLFSQFSLVHALLSRSFPLFPNLATEAAGDGATVVSLGSVIGHLCGLRGG